MQRGTVGLLKELRAATWFNNIGAKDVTVPIVLSNWPDAISSCESIEWENLRLEMSNRLTECLAANCKSKLRAWNSTVQALKKETMPLVRNKLGLLSAINQLPKVVEDSVQWDILGCCLEAEHAAICPSGFYVDLAFYYIKGHFPCGWEGNWPNGRLIVF